jgi:hypothetical protein
MMEENERKELREWAAGVMGWERHPNSLGWFKYVNDSGALFVWYKKYWKPDIDLNQTFMVVQRMDELGWWLFWNNEENTAHFFSKKGVGEGVGKGDDHALAILLAAKATGVK